MCSIPVGPWNFCGALLYQLIYQFRLLFGSTMVSRSTRCRLTTHVTCYEADAGSFHRKLINKLTVKDHHHHHTHNAPSCCFHFVADKIETNELLRLLTLALLLNCRFWRRPTHNIKFDSVDGLTRALCLCAMLFHWHSRRLDLFYFFQFLSQELQREKKIRKKNLFKLKITILFTISEITTVRTTPRTLWLDFVLCE